MMKQKNRSLLFTLISLILTLVCIGVVRTIFYGFTGVGSIAEFPTLSTLFAKELSLKVSAVDIYDPLLSSMREVSADMFVTLGLVTVIVLLVLLICLNHRKKKVILTTAEKLKSAEARYRLLFEQSPVSLWEEDLSAVRSYLDTLLEQGVSDLDSYFDEHPYELRRCADKIKILNVNQRTLELYEMGRKGEVSSVADILPDGSEWIIKEEILALLDHGHFEITVENRTLQGRKITIEFRAVVAAGYEKTWGRVYASVVDITEKTRLKHEKQEYEKQLLQSRKLEAIGSLAGGIAHDFNNILAPIMGRAELMLFESKEAHVQDNCREIIDASKRARCLVRQILAFSREVDQEIRPVSLRDIVLEVVRLAGPTLPSTITLQTEFGPKLPYVMADSGQLHQVVMNLVTNAFHALEGSEGTISMSLEETVIDLDSCMEDDVPPGRYLRLTVSDTGHGMDGTTMDKIFDPYFTTKSREKGTGLGLSVVHGILRAYGGRIQVESEPGVGSAFHIILPVVDVVGARNRSEKRQFRMVPGDEHILLVDDEKSVAEVTAHMLRKMGYTVTMRVSSMEALEAFRSLSDRIDLVLTDLTMPQMTGLQLFSEIRRIRQDMKVIICTGFSEQLDSSRADTIGVDAYITKPVLMEELSYTLRSVLDGE